MRFPQARLEQKTIDGKDYRVLAYQTSLVAAKSGERSVGPASLNFAVGIPQKRRQRSPFDDPFNDPSGNDPFANFFGNQRIEREMTVTSDPKKLRIKSLPTPRPEGFAGAVGQFSLVVSAKPTNVKMGDPITLQSVISGRGNFDLVTSPVLSDATGWRTYPATGKLVPNDEMGVSGDKTFEMAIIPEQKHAAVPTTRFVYFDPTQEKYLTLESPAIPITIEGQPLPSPTPVPPKLASVQPKPTPNAPPAAPDLPPVKTALVGNNGSFLPIWKTSAFWLVQSIPFLLLVGLAWPKIAAAFAPDTNETRMTNLRKERQSLAAKVTSADPATFFPAAARQMEIDASLAGKSHSSPSEIIESLGFLDAEAETAREIFIRRDELAYGGGTSRKQSGRELSPEILRRYQGVLNK